MGHADFTRLCGYAPPPLRNLPTRRGRSLEPDAVLHPTTGCPCPAMRPENVYLGNLFGELEELNAGVTTLFDWSYINNTPEHTDAARKPWLPRIIFWKKLGYMLLLLSHKIGEGLSATASQTRSLPGFAGPFAYPISKKYTKRLEN